MIRQSDYLDLVYGDRRESSVRDLVVDGDLYTVILRLGVQRQHKSGSVVDAVKEDCWPGLPIVVTFSPTDVSVD
jgi:hypothetical protein